MHFFAQEAFRTTTNCRNPAIPFLENRPLIAASDCVLL
jgi:hypothetical protein